MRARIAAPPVAPPAAGAELPLAGEVELFGLSVTGADPLRDLGAALGVLSGACCDLDAVAAAGPA